MLGLGVPKKKPVVPAETASVSPVPQPSWLQGEAPMPPKKKKKVTLDAGGQLSRLAMRAA